MLETKSKTILVAFDWYDHRVYRGIAQYCAEHHWHLSPYCFSERLIPENWPGDGAITCYGDSLARFIDTLDMPKVDVSMREMPEAVPRVLCDNREIGREAARYFLNKGYKDFAYFSWAGVSVNQVRKKAFLETLLENGVPQNRIYTLDQPEDEVLRDWEKHTEVLVDQIREMPRPVAIFTGQDNLGVTLIEACVSAGIAVPDEVAVLGVDNIEFLCDCAVVPLSSVDSHLTELGYMAAAQLGRLMRGEIDHSEPVLTVPTGGVVCRQSTDALAVTHPAVGKALKLMRDDFKDGVVLEDVCRHVGLSKRGLEKAFKKHLGDSPAAVLRQIRLNYAKNSLTQTDAKIESIALECGYSNSSNLSHAFNREVGMSPQDYRHRYRSPLFIERDI